MLSRRHTTHEVVSLISDDDDAPVATFSAPACAAPPSARAKAPSNKRKRTKGAGWRRRAGDAGTAAEAPSELSASAAALAKSSTASALRQQLLAFGLRPGARSKEGLSLRLIRAQHAAAASEKAYAAARGASAKLPRFDYARAGHVRGSLEACRLCDAAIPPPRRTFCSDECVHFHLLRTSGSHVRKALAIRDGRICALCGVDAGAAYAISRRVLREALAAGSHSLQSALEASVAGGPFRGYACLSVNRRGRSKVREGSFWQADHVHPVADGGGCCGLLNLRTLCTPCHSGVTALAAGRRAVHRRALGADARPADGASADGALAAAVEEEEEEEEEEEGEEEREDDEVLYCEDGEERRGRRGRRAWEDLDQGTVRSGRSA